MEEWVDILDAQGHPTGKHCVKTEAHAKGWFHTTVHVWLYTQDGSVLVQQRGSTKTTYPLLWDVSAAGHVAAGEKIRVAAVRELKEKVGLAGY